MLNVIPNMSFFHLTFLDNTLKQYVIFFTIIVWAYLIAVVFNNVIHKKIKKATKHTKTKLDDVLADSLARPLTCLIVISGLFLAFQELTLPDLIENIISKIVTVLMIGALVLVINRTSDALVTLYLKPIAEDPHTSIDTQVMNLLRRVMHIIFWVIALIFIISNLGYNITSLVTGLGIGGLAIALALQPTLSNFFSSLTIIFDKPFRVNSIIKLEDGVIGTVQEIGFRSTVIRTLQGSELIIPNNKLIDSKITNVTRRRVYRVDQVIGLVYHTSLSDLQKAIQIVKKIIDADSETSEDAWVHFTEFGSHGLNIQISYWIKQCENYPVILETKNRLNLAIKEQFEKTGLEFAFPTQTIHLEKKD